LPQDLDFGEGKGTDPMRFNSVIDRLTKKHWSRTEIDAMVGDAIEGYLTYATSADVRAGAASGGTTSALLIHALEIGAIDGAIVCCTRIVDGAVRAEFSLARTREEILAARGSKYVETRFMRDVLEILRLNEGRFAVCGLPCDISALHRWGQKEPELSAKVVYKIAFLCGHNSRTALIDGVIAKLAAESGGEDLTAYTFRSGHWRGRLSAEFNNGVIVEKPFSYFSDYRNLNFFSERKCMACSDHFGYAADLSIGDVWLYSLRDDPIKHSGVLVRTPTAQELVQSASAAGVIDAQAVGREYILDGQSRVAPTHYNVSARVKAGEKLGIRIKDTVFERITPLKFLSAYLVMWNMRFSEKEHAHWIFRLPRPLIKLYLYIKKGLETVH